MEGKVFQAEKTAPYKVPEVEVHKGRFHMKEAISVWLRPYDPGPKAGRSQIMQPLKPMEGVWIVHGDRTHQKIRERSDGTGVGM